MNDPVESALPWHLVRCGSSWALPLVAATLRDALGAEHVECFYREEDHVLRGRRITRKMPLFQTPYIFAAWETLDAEAWHRVRWTRGVREIVGGAVPAIVGAAEVDAWRALASDTGVIDEEELFEIKSIERGEEVSFEYGALGYRVGNFYQARGNSTGVTIELLGRITVVYVPSHLIRRKVARKRRVAPQFGRRTPAENNALLPGEDGVIAVP